MSRVLVVDDDSGNRRILESRLAEQGHDVVAGENGALGISLARESRFDLLLVSTGLRSGVDGFEVCRRVKALPEGARPGIVLFCEQSPVPEVLERGYQAGCDAFVTRPDLPSLEHVLANLLRQRARVAGLEEEIGLLREQGRRQPIPRAPGSQHERTPKEAGDRAGAVRELACGRPEGLLLVDSEGTVRHADRGACEMLGGGIEGWHLGSLAPSSGLEAFVRDARLEAREGFRFDLAPRKGHAARALSATVVPLVVQPGQHDPEIRIVLLHDAARRRLAAEVLRVQELGIPRQELGPLLEAARETYRPEAMIGASEATTALRRALAHLCRSSAPVLLRGERGTGKERVARILHYAGTSTGAFVQVRCGALTPEDLDLELFGRARGAPEAVPERPGLFHLAQDGTLYLEEIGDAPLETQARILRFLEEGVVLRVGSRKVEHVDVRLVASTSDPLEGRLREGRFSRELFQRLETATLTLTPLAERGEDIEPLVRHYLERSGARRGVTALADEVLSVLRRHEWPGNVAELVDCVEQACASAERGIVRLEDLPRGLRDMRRSPGERDLIPAVPPGRTPLAGTHAVPVPEREIAPQPAPTVRDARPWDITDDDPVSLELYEKKALLRALDCVGGDKLAAARLLNVGKSTLYRKLKQFGIA